VHESLTTISEGVNEQLISKGTYDSKQFQTLDRNHDSNAFNNVPRATSGIPLGTRNS
jgi:hypothetical protein